MNDKVIFHDDGTATVIRMSAISGKEHSMQMKLTRSDYLAWNDNNQVIQEALPHLTEDEREFLMTGITPDEWDDQFDYR